MYEVWEEELFAANRWGRLQQWFKIKSDRAKVEYERLKELRDDALPLDESSKKIVEQIIALEICNWKLERSILDLCEAIGTKKPTETGIGHMASMTHDRWKKIWAYYLLLRDWLVGEEIRGYKTILRICDPDSKIRNHIFGLLVERSELKILYAERFCLYLEYMLAGSFKRSSIQATNHINSVKTIDKQIRKLEPKSEILKALNPVIYGEYYCYAGLELCHHKLFRRFDIILSSIGSNSWRTVMPRKGTDGLERAETLNRYLSPIESWISGKERKEIDSEISKRIYKSLGKRDNVKLFLASLLGSLLRSQQISARILAERRMKDS